LDLRKPYTTDVRVARMERDIAVTAAPSVEGLAFQQALLKLQQHPDLARAFAHVRWIAPSDLEAFREQIEGGALGLVVIAGDLATAIDATYPEIEATPEQRLRAASGEYARVVSFDASSYASVARLKRYSANLDLPLVLRLIAPRLRPYEAERCADIITGCLEDAAIALRIKDAPDERPMIGMTSGKDIVSWRLAAAQALAHLAPDVTGVRSGWWPREVFLHGVSPAIPCPVVFEMTGLPRILVYGPYLWLAAGAWRLRWSFEVDANGGEARMRFDACVGHTELSSRLVQLSGAGTYEAELVFDITEPGPIEARLWLESAAIDGELAFKGISVVSHEEF